MMRGQAEWRGPLRRRILLGLSRVSFVRFSEREDSEAWLTGLQVLQAVYLAKPAPWALAPGFSYRGNTKKFSKTS
jgi:hypothetical protein